MLDFGEDYEEEMEEEFRKIRKCDQCGRELLHFGVSMLAKGGPRDIHFYCDDCYATLTES